MYLFRKGRFISLMLQPEKCHQIVHWLFSRLNCVFLYHEAISYILVNCSYFDNRSCFHLCMQEWKISTGRISYRRLTYCLQYTEGFLQCLYSLFGNRYYEWANQAVSFGSGCFVPCNLFLVECLSHQSFHSTYTTKILYRQYSFSSKVGWQKTGWVLPLLPAQNPDLIPVLLTLKLQSSIILFKY